MLSTTGLNEFRFDYVQAAVIWLTLQTATYNIVHFLVLEDKCYLKILDNVDRGANVWFYLAFPII